MEENQKAAEHTKINCKDSNTIGGSALESSSSCTAPTQGLLSFCSMHSSGDTAGSKSTISQGFQIPLKPRSRQSVKARSSLPHLQPLSIKRRYLEEFPEERSDESGESTHRGKRDSRKLLEMGKFSFSDKQCSMVTDHIYLGSDVAAKNREILRQNGITHVINCAGSVCLEYFKAELIYTTLWLEDRPSEDITSILYDVFDYFEEVKEQGGNVFVHCVKGISRSTSLVIAYLMWSKGQSFTDAFKYVKSARGITNPNIGFAGQLSEYQKRMHATPFSQNSLLKMYRMAPYSSYAPLHLVPKSVDHPGPDALDSRGAFIVQIPSTIYVWIGNSCNPFMQTKAETAALQLIRYERAKGSVIVTREGHEEDEFSDVLSKTSILSDGHDISEEGNLEASCFAKNRDDPASRDGVGVGVGEKRAESYNLDFEIFEKAIEGGVMPPFSVSEPEIEIHLPARDSGWNISRTKFVFGSVKELVTLSRTASDIYSSEFNAQNDCKAGDMEKQLFPPGP